MPFMLALRHGALCDTSPHFRVHLIDELRPIPDMRVPRA
jgi:hypothetical protein